MPLVSKIVAAITALGHRRPGTSRETYILDRRKGSVELRMDPHLLIKLEMFKRFTVKKTWGFELTLRNHAEKTIDELLIVFNKKYSIIVDKIGPDSMKIKSLEFKPEEFDSDEFSVDLSVVISEGRKAHSEAYSVTIPMRSIITELKDAGRITPIQEEIETYRPGSIDKSVMENFVAESMKQATIRPRVPVESPGKPIVNKESLQHKLAELTSQKTEIEKSFMKRQIDYNTFSQLMNPIVQEMILIQAQLGKMEDS